MSNNNIIIGRTLPRIAVVRVLQSQLAVYKSEIKDKCPEYIIHPDNVLVQELPASTRYIIKAYDRLSLRLTSYGVISKKFPPQN